MPVVLTTKRLIQIADTLHRDPQFLVKNFSREGEAYPQKKIQIRSRKGRRLVAPYVSEYLPGVKIARTSYRTNEIEPALIKPARDITAVDVQAVQIDETEYSTKTPEQRAAQLVLEDSEELLSMIDRRKEEQMNQLIFTKKIEQIGAGVKEVIDYEADGVEVLPTDQEWDKDGVNPLEQMAARAVQAQRNSGKKITKVLMHHDAAAAFVNNKAVQKYLDIRNFNMGNIAPASTIEGASYIGRINYPQLNVDIYSYSNIYQESYKSDGTLYDTPVTKEIVPSGMVALLPDGELAQFEYAMITIVDPTTKQFRSIALPVVGQSWVTIDPAQRWMQFLSRPIPIPFDIDSWVVMRVITPTPVEQVV